MIYFITGSHGSGKTSCMPYLKELLPHMIMHDSDEIGVPSNPTKRWRQETTEIWLQKLLNQKQDVCLFGQLVLGEILACPSAIKLNPIPFCLFDCNDNVRLKRLKNRGTIPTQDMLGWASWLRIHHTDPQWQQHVIKEDSWDKLNFSRWDYLESWEGLALMKTIDTTELDLPHVAACLSEWIKSSQKKEALK